MEKYTVLSRPELKVRLNQILTNTVSLEHNEVMNETISNMLFYIGDQEKELRDELIYKTFTKLIIDDRFIKQDQLKEILAIVLDDRHLYLNLDKNSVLTRSFSILVVALILNRNNNETCLSIEEFNHVKDKVLTYFEFEKDYRGYEKKVGWIHAIAHTCDALEEIVLNQNCSHDDCIHILAIALRVFTNPDTIFSHEEDERFVVVLNAMIKRELISIKELNHWIEKLILVEDNSNYETFVKRVNGKNLLRSIHFSFKRIIKS
ncbi:DUF2785 domain-containing protein [Anaerorhabdus sp.]|uniref:DUF2785 domain-containing protein n=1 Tax=Anaerorhabdus sp. TaxID=1872524 RepID=UPI002FCC0784